ncbi:MAG: hypothetical protein H6P96_632 [Candidatus Aminicenantes bacterium]|nr:hypothetical protein [Candidatus Aminicenantes bacterium]
MPAAFSPVVEREEPDEAAVAGEDVQDGDDRVAAAEHVDAAFFSDGGGHQLGRGPDRRHLP